MDSLARPAWLAPCWARSGPCSWYPCAACCSRDPRSSPLGPGSPAHTAWMPRSCRLGRVGG